MLDKAYLGWGIPTFMLNEKNEVIYHKWDIDILVNLDAAQNVRKRWKEERIPVLWNETMNIIHVGFEDDDDNLYLFGPVSFGSISKAQMQDYQLCHRWKAPEAVLCHIPFDRIISCLSTMYVLLTGRRISEETFLKNMDSMELISPLTRQNYIKSCEYAVVTAISIMRKAAVEVGVPEEICYRISFEYSKKLLGCASDIEIIRVYADVVNEFGRRIKKVKQKGNIGELKEQCKRYIARNIRRKFTVEEMADELGYHPGYLSRVFTQREGISLQKYILRERLRLAANILRNSNEKIGAISDYLCFHSQSYMTEQFVKEYGMTPTEYRKKNKL